MTTHSNPSRRLQGVEETHANAERTRMLLDLLLARWMQLDPAFAPWALEMIDRAPPYLPADHQLVDAAKSMRIRERAYELARESIEEHLQGQAATHQPQ